MSWFFETRIRESDKNGIIRATRRFGRWRVAVDGFEQTGPQAHAMWQDAFKKTSYYVGRQKVHRALMLGLGGGGEVATISRHFPTSKLTVIEHDPQMIALAKELKLYHPASFPDVVCEDAARAVPKLRGMFDLIIVDLFKGNAPSPLSRDMKFLEALDLRLSEGGLLLVNGFQHEEILSAVEQRFMVTKKWQFGKNHLGLFQKKTISTCLAEGYAPVREWPDFDPLLGMSDLHPSRTGKDDAGVYWRLWPFSFEKYHGNEEPRILPLPKGKRTPLRIIMWQRLTRVDTPDGWRSFGDAPTHKFGFVKLTDPDYQARWTKTARNDRARWRASYLNSLYSVELAPFDEFAEAYLKSTVPRIMRKSMLGEIQNRMKNPKTPVTFLVARSIHDRHIVAGIARMYSSSLPIAYYLSGFFTREAKHHPVMTGLLDHWFEEVTQKRIRFIDLGAFWRRGVDASWKGFSSFKAKFNPLYFFYPPVLYRFEVHPRLFQKS